MIEMIKGLSQNDTELKALYDVRASTQSYLQQRWEDYAGWTLPYLYLQDEEPKTATTELQGDYQSTGAQATNHLANKIAMTLFAPGRPFFRLDLTDEQRIEVMENSGLTGAELDHVLSLTEKRAMRNMEKVRMRTSVILALKHLIVLGNALMYFPEDKQQSTQVYNLRDWTIKRDLSGNILQLVMRDRISVQALSPELQAIVMAAGFDIEADVDLFTGVTRQDNDKFFVKQEIEDISIVPDTFETYEKDNLPWIPLTWELPRGYDYGIGLVEQYAGDFHQISSLSEALLNISAIAADIKILVSPMGNTDIDGLNNSPSGTYVYGNRDDVDYFQLEKLGDLSFITEQKSSYERRIGAAFLLNTSVTRDAERVTAEEIRLQANELESSLGGVYSRLAEEMQQPLAKRLLQSLNALLIDVDPVIVTGLESLSRTSELDQILLFFNDLALLEQLPELVQERLKVGDVMATFGSARNIDYKKFLKSEDEVSDDREEKAEAEAKLAGQTKLAEGEAEIMAQPPQQT